LNQFQKIASNFAILGIAEVICRSTSVVLTLSLPRRLGWAGFGRVEFAFNVVFWSVLVLRDCFETIITREIARHPSIIRSLVNHILAVKLTLAVAMLTGLAALSILVSSDPLERWVLSLYGLLLLTTALGLDFVFRGTEAMGLIAVSLFVRTAVYCAGVWIWVTDPSRILLVPICLAVGELTGISLVWVAYTRRYGLPRPVLSVRFLLVFLNRGRSVGLIHLCQAVIVSSDLLVVGLLSNWADVGRYGAPQRIIAAVMGFGTIFQQAVFPALSRNWRKSPESGRRLLDFAVRVLVSGFIPVAVGGTLLAEPLVRFLWPVESNQAGLLLAVGIWKAPLLSLAFLYQAALIASNRESQGVRLLVWGSTLSAPLIALFHWQFGLPGAAFGVLVAGLGLVVSGYSCLASGPNRPAEHHHLGQPILASVVMVPVCLVGLRAHVVVAVLAGAVTYLIVMKWIGGLDFRSGSLETA
jgi:O-antigen/teichoic acid export membrane protein